MYYFFNIPQKHKQPKCKTLLKAIDLAREAERLCQDVEKYYAIAMEQERIYAERKSEGIGGIPGGFTVRRGPCNLERWLRDNYKSLKLLVKDCGKCKKLATCSILNYVKEDILKTLKEEHE